MRWIVVHRGDRCTHLGICESEEPPNATIQPLSFLRIGGATLYGLGMYHALRRQPAAGRLVRLVRLMDARRLRPLIAVEEPWTEAGRVAQLLLERRFAGKAVLHVTA
jgi:NADPH:quinone reductase-like Zn-dependent oxidoreductase